MRIERGAEQHDGIGADRVASDSRAAGSIGEGRLHQVHRARQRARALARTLHGIALDEWLDIRDDSVDSMPEREHVAGGLALLLAQFQDARLGVL